MDYSLHAEQIVQGALIRVVARLGEGYSEAGHSGRRLGKSNAVLRRSLNKPGMDAVRLRGDGAVARAVGVDGHVRGRRYGIRGFRAERDGVRSNRVDIGPFHGFADMDRDRLVREAHDAEGIGAARGGDNLAAADDHAITGAVLHRLHVIHVIQQRGCFGSCFAVIESLIMGQRHGGIENVDGTGHVLVEQANHLEVPGGGR